MHIVCPACSVTNRVAPDRPAAQAVCGRCATPLLPAEPVALDDARLPAYLARTEAPVLVDFWAGWCGPCKMMAPQFAAAARARPDWRFVKVDTDANPQASARHAIRSIPTLALFRGGREIGRLSGAVASGELIRWADAQLARA